jgi:hypothetical protein
MVTRKSVLAAIGALALGSSLSVPVQGTVATNLHTNHLTFSGPVALPGVTLPGGTYIFERVVPTNPDVVVVRSLDRTRVLYMASTDRVLRPEWLDTERAVVFGEARRDAPPPIAAWYPVGERMGHAFIYKTR